MLMFSLFYFCAIFLKKKIIKNIFVSLLTGNPLLTGKVSNYDIQNNSIIKWEGKRYVFQLKRRKNMRKTTIS